MAVRSDDREQALSNAGNYPEGIDATEDGRFVFVACWEDNTLVKIEVEDLSVAGKAAVGDGPRAFGTFLR